jgi:Leucine-rich repeat (LRR) protein
MTGRSLKNFPKEILNIQNLDLGVNWFEGYELTKLDLSNNMIESIPEEIAV